MLSTFNTLSTVSQSTISKPRPPTNLTGISSTNDSITFSFTPPPGNVTSYTVTAVPDTGSRITQTFNAPATSYTITGLPYTLSPVNYTISLVAKKINLVSEPSISFSYSKLATTTAPNAPSGLNRTNFTDTSISISWNTPNDGSIINYTVKAIDQNNNITTKNTNSISTNYTITGLVLGNYTISIAATNIFGTSIYSDIINTTNVLQLTVTSDSYLVTSNILLCYSIRLVISSYSGATIQIRANTDSSNTSAVDFYSDPYQSYLTTGPFKTGISYSSWLSSKGATTGYVVKWYDQSGSGNHAINNTLSQQPSLVQVTNNSITKWVIYFQQTETTTPNNVLYFTTPIVSTNTIYSFFCHFTNGAQTVLPTIFASVSESNPISLRIGSSGNTVNPTSLLGDNNKNDWFVKGGSPKLNYVNNISSTSLSGFGTSSWQVISLSVTTPAISSNPIGLIFATASPDGNRSITGYCVDFMMFNTYMNETSMQNFYTNRIF